jgi:peptidoglycan/xylan/chitin deacetylase (PgdA/CDA1 family)
MKVVSSTAILRWAAAGLFHGGLIRPVSRAAGYVRKAPAFPILTYHRVNDDDDPFFPAVPTRVFEKQMAFLARTYRVLTVEELVEGIRRGRLPRNALAITFDDGYRDNLTHAAPILTRYGLPATIFLATGFIGTSKVFWFDRLAMAFKMTGESAFAAPWGGILSLASQADRILALNRTLAHFKQVPDDALQPSLQRLLEILRVPDGCGPQDLMLSWDEVHALARQGFSIGAHTVNHPILSRVAPQRAWMEILGSRTMIQSVCGCAPRAFAYPNGKPEDYTETIKHMVREAGFTCAVTTRFGFNTTQTSPYELNRGGPWEEHLPTFAVKLVGYRLMTV